jgi:hypothetical protein
MSVGSKPGPSTAGTSAGTNNSTISLPQWYTNQWQDIVGQGNNLANNQNYFTMGLTPDQMTSSIATNNLLDSWLSQPQPSAYDVFGMASTPFQAPQATLAPGTAANASMLQQATPGMATAAQSNAAQLYPTQIAPFMNPYLNNAIDPTLNRLQQQQWDIAGRTNADAAAAGMFGGSRGAVANAISDRDYRTNLAQTAGNMLNTGWNNAAGLAQGNVANRQATNLSNATLANQVALQNAQQQTQASIANAQNATSRANNAAGIGGQLMGQQLQSDTQTNLANMGAQNATAQADANRFLAALAQQGNTNSQNLQGTLSIIQLLNTLGGQQQATGQNSLNNYWQNLNNLFNLLKSGISPGQTSVGQTSGTTTGTTQSPIDIGGALLSALGVGTKLFGSSDREDKTDITKLGKDPQTGLDQYAYRYKGDPKHYPKVVGPMAQDIEKVMPGVTRLIGGHMVAPMSTLRQR